MTRIFITVLNMSVAASMVIGVVLALRLFLGRAPRIFSYFLWLAVVLRLLCPFSLQVSWGIIPVVSLAQAAKGEELLEGGHRQGQEVYRINNGLGKLPGNAGKGEDREQGRETDSRKTESLFSAREEIWCMAAGVWLAGVIALLLYGMSGYLFFMGKIKKCGNSRKTGLGGKHPIILSGEIEEPFVAGFFKPSIYLPEGLGQAQRELVTLHEEIHIARRDYLVKAAAFFAVSIHWFNPLAWLAFYLMEQDMEVSCDEMVLKKAGHENKKEYARTLLYLSGAGGWKMGHPLAFGEKSVKVRIKNIMKYKGVKTWAAAAALAVVLGASALLLVNGSWNREAQAVEEITLLPAENFAYTESIGEDDISSIDHNYYVSGEQADGSAQEGAARKLPAEQITASDIPPEDIFSEGTSAQDKGENAHEYIQAEDPFGSLCRRAEGAHVDLEIYYQNPVEHGRVSDGFGTRTNPVTKEKKFHSGIDFAAEQGTPILAAADGVVLETGFDAAAGNYVILQHGNGELTYYACCDEISVKEGETVAAGGQIATVGKTGASTGAHLHFALSRDGVYIEPGVTDEIGSEF